MKRNFLSAATLAVLVAGGVGVAQAQKEVGSAPLLQSSSGVALTADNIQARNERRQVSRGVSTPGFGLDLTGVDSIDGAGSTNNVVILLDIGAGNTVTGLSWDVGIDTVTPGEGSWMSEAAARFSDSAGGNWIQVRPGSAVGAVGNQEFSSAGVVSFAANALPDIVLLADGILKVEFLETFDDALDAADANLRNHSAPALVAGLGVSCSDQAACDAAVGALLGSQSNLSIVKTAPSGVVAGGPFSYQLDIGNAGPVDEPNAVVTDVLPAGITFVSSDCGATAAGGTVTWNAGALANGASATCTLVVSQSSATCSLVSNTATITGDNVDPSTGNNSSTAANVAADPILDPSFELGTVWNESSSTFGTVLCTVADCGVGGGTGPRTGSAWVWLGGVSAAAEAGFAEQTVVIPESIDTLNFWIEQAACNAANGASDYLTLSIDGTEVWRTDATDAACGVVGYRQIQIPVSTYADGGSHVIGFDSETAGNGAVTNFFIDDVSLTGSPVCSGSPNFSFVGGDVNLGTALPGSTLAGLITITNTGTAAGIVDAPTFTGPFALGVGGTCPAAPFTLAAGQSCTFGVVLTATTVGTYVGQVSVNAGGAVIAANLAGAILSPPPTFIPVSSPWALGLMMALMGLFAGGVMVRRRG